MSDEANDQDRTEEATQFKLREARRRGQVIKSPEVNSLVILSGALLVTSAFGAWMINGVLKLSHDVFELIGKTELTIPYVIETLHGLGLKVLFLLSPLLVMTVIAGILSNFLQTGPVFTFHPLKPDWSKLNPARGWKRMFSMRSLYDGLKTIIKFSVLFGVLYGVVMHLLPNMLSLLQRSMSAYPSVLLQIATSALLALLVVFALLAFGDAAYSRWEYRKKMRMSKREVREETRRHEGDPKIRARRRDLLLGMRKNVRSISSIPGSDILITNPTHFAIALKFDRATMHAPKVVSKGAGDLAKRMRQLAYRYNVPVVESPALARRMFREVKLDGFVPEDTYAQVATLMRPIFEARVARGARP